MAVKLGLLVHGHNGGYKCSRYKKKVAHCQQVEELTVIEGQFGILQLVLCRRASDGNLVNVPGAWVFSICRCPHCCRSQIVALVMSLYLAACAFKAGGVRRICANLG